MSIRRTLHVGRLRPGIREPGRAGAAPIPFTHPSNYAGNRGRRFLGAAITTATAVAVAAAKRRVQNGGSGGSGGGVDPKARVPCRAGSRPAVLRAQLEFYRIEHHRFIHVRDYDGTEAAAAAVSQEPRPPMRAGAAPVTAAAYWRIRALGFDHLCPRMATAECRTRVALRRVSCAWCARDESRTLPALLPRA